MNKKIRYNFFIVIFCLFVMWSIVYTINHREENKKENEIVETETETEINKVVEENGQITLEPEIEKEPEVKVEPKPQPKPQPQPKPEIEQQPIQQPETTDSVFYLSDYERNVLECIVMGESGSEPYDGQVLVAQCILNACLKDGLQPSQVKNKYQYSGWSNNPSESVKNAVAAVFDNGFKITNEPILYFYSPKYSSGSWHETQRFIIEVGGHRFFAQK